MPAGSTGPPPVGNANFAWLQHIVHHLSPTGTAGVVLTNGSLASQHSGEGAIREALVKAGLVECIVTLPAQLFYSTQIPVCLWILTRARQKKPAGDGRTVRNRRHEILFIDARKFGSLVDRVHRELHADELARIASTYHRWRDGDAGAGIRYEDVPGFCRSASTNEIASHQYALTPGRYIGAETKEEHREPFDETMQRLGMQLEEQFAEGVLLEAQIMNSLRALGYRWNAANSESRQIGEPFVLDGPCMSEHVSRGPAKTSGEEALSGRTGDRLPAISRDRFPT